MTCCQRFTPRLHYLKPVTSTVGCRGDDLYGQGRYKEGDKHAPSRQAQHQYRACRTVLGDSNRCMLLWVKMVQRIFQRTPAMTQVMLTITELRGAAGLTLSSLGAALLALAQKRTRLAATLVLALGSAGLLSVIFKVLIGNTRPVDALIGVHDASFPSGHLLSGTVFYGLLAAPLLSSHVRRGVRALGVTLLLLIIAAIDLSRLYLGVHWPSDLLGSLGLALIVLAALLFFLYYPPPIRWIDTLRVPGNPGIIRVPESACWCWQQGAWPRFPAAQKFG